MNLFRYVHSIIVYHSLITISRGNPNENQLFSTNSRSFNQWRKHREAQAWSYECQFELERNSTMWYLKTSTEEPSLPKIIWSHLKFELPVTTSPHYPIHIVSEMKDVRINLQAGVIFDSKGCVSAHSLRASDFHRRKRYLQRIGPGPANALNRKPAERFFETVAIDPSKPPKLIYYDTVFYFWGSLYPRDWQHAVIDFLPMYNQALPFLISNPQIPVLVGPYIRFFENEFPFNVTKFIYRDIRFKGSGGGEADLFRFKRLIYVDIINRTQSYTLQGSYDRILPFLQPSFQYDSSLAVDWIKRIKLAVRQTKIGGANELKLNNVTAWSPVHTARKDYAHHQHDTHTGSLLSPNIERNLVVYLDRSQLLRDERYIASAGKVAEENKL